MDAAFLLNSRAHKINEDNDKGLVSFPLSFLREVLFACVVTHDMGAVFKASHFRNVKQFGAKSKSLRHQGGLGCRKNMSET